MTLPLVTASLSLGRIGANALRGSEDIDPPVPWEALCGRG